MLYKTLVFPLVYVVLLCSCTANKVSGQHNDGMPISPLFENVAVTGSVIEILGKTQIDVPHEVGTQLIAEYDHNDNLVVFFTPSIPDFSIEHSSSSLVVDIQKDYDADRIKSIVISTASPTRFLLSKQSDFASRIVLVPQEEDIPPVLPVNHINSLSFKPVNDSLQIVTYSSLPYEIIPSSAGGFSLVLRKSKFAESLLKKYDVSQLKTGFDSVVAQNDADDARLLFSGDSSPTLSIMRKNDETYILLKQNMVTARLPLQKKQAMNLTTEEEEETSQELDTLFPGMKKNYTGENISIDLQNAEVEHVLRLISEISGYNLILDDEITGKISLKLVDIPWDQALDLVLLQRGLGMVLKGNIMRIASINKLSAEREQLQKAREAALQAKESMEQLAPLKSEYIQINYNTAADFEGKVKSFLTPRGKASSDQRTNMLIVTDTEETLRRINSFIKKLDRAERQVMIEARLVYATDEFQRDLGVSWGIDYKHADSGDQWSREFEIGKEGLNTFTTFSLGGQVGKLFGKDLFNLDARLRLGEEKNLVKTISSPRILTLNNSRAEILQGTKLATQGESESGGTTTEYEDAVLKISVLPQITPDNKLILDIEIEDDSPVSSVSGSRDIDTKSAKTKMMVDDRETIVIGGVLKTTEETGKSQIPGLGDIPGLGWLFKNKYDKIGKTELLVFIQPRII
ncbi:MAG: type IV pilus secretin PilQ [Desulfomicrobium sp.]|nr:type IV pilus secretin PilQ [Desulfomicrobium sp.]